MAPSSAARPHTSTSKRHHRVRPSAESSRRNQVDADKHPEVDVTDDQFNEVYPIGEVLWPMIRDSPVMRAKFRFQSQQA